MTQQFRDQLKGHVEPLAQRFAPGALEMKPVGSARSEAPTLRPGAAPDRRRIARCELIGARRLGLAPGAQVELGDTQPFGLVGDEGEPKIELGHDLEESVLHPFGGSVLE